jgi:acyl-CoA synthetase (NDP forming)
MTRIHEEDFLPRDLASVLKAGFNPRAVAVYGATDKMPGLQYVDAVLDSEFAENIARANPLPELVRGLETRKFDHDRVALVNPTQKLVHDIETIPSALDSGLKGQLDLAVIATPLHGVNAAIEDCGRCEIGLAQVIAAGYSEIGPEGAALEAELVELAAQNGVRLLGPNSMGFINVGVGFRASRPYYFLDAEPGSVSILAQSGTAGSVLMEEISLLGHGIDLWVSVGNCADVGVPELVSFLAGRDSTRVIVIYLETVTVPERLSQAITEARANDTEVVILKTGRTAAGGIATASHTGAVASPHVFFELMMKDSGAVCVETISEAAEAAAVLDSIGRIKGGVAIVLGSGGEAALSADLCEENGVALAKIRPETMSEIRRLVPEIGTENPIDFTFAASQRGYVDKIYNMIVDEPDVECMVYLDAGLWPQGTFSAEDEARREALERQMASKVQIIKEVRSHDVIPMRPQRSALVRRGVAAVGQSEVLWKILSRLSVSDSAHKRETVRVAPVAIGAQATVEPPVTISELNALDALRTAGVPVIPYRLVDGEADLSGSLEEFGSPVVMKAIEPGVSHKTERGFVRLDLFSQSDAQEAFESLRKAAGSAAQIVVQPQVRGILGEIIVGVVNDERWGLHLMVSSGGLAAEEVADRVWSRLPISRATAEELLEGVHICRAIVRRRPGGRKVVESLADLIVAVSEYASSHGEQLSELDINPVILTDAGAIAVDALISLISAPV